MAHGNRIRIPAALLLTAAAHVAGAASWQGSGEMPLDYHAYIRDFNSGDDRGLIEKYFAPDTQMISASGVRSGHKEMNEFLAWAHDGVREIIRPQVVMWDKDHIFADNAIVGDFTSIFTALEDAPDFVVKPLKKGESVRVPVFVYYTLRDGLISRIRVARSGTPASGQ